MRFRVPSRVFALLAALAASFVAASPCLAQLTQARVAEGALAGKPEGPVGAFLGVPFAAPPVGAHRWTPPRAAAKWKGERKADQFAASCQQTVSPQGFGPWTAEYVVQGAVSEDCLYLNIWTPAHNAQDRLPVLVWIYGGGFRSGSGSVALYDGAALAAKGIVVVSVNYRVGVYGFLAHPELTAESPAHASGNYGLLDQVAGLRWVRDNIAAFGGDATQVTIAGQSAGAASVHYLIASPLAKGLFARAIAQSGSGIMGLAAPDRATAEALGKALGEGAGRSLTLAQLRDLSAAQLDERVAKLASDDPPRRFGPIVDGFFLPDAQSVGRNLNDTPILTGMTANEMTGLDPDYGKTTAASFEAQVKTVYGKFAQQVRVFYPATTDEEARASLDALTRDRGLAAMDFWARERLSTTRHPIYAYLWTHPEPGPEAARYGAFHSSELPYVFGTLDTSKRPFAPVDRMLAKELSTYWVNFVKAGDPNGDGAVHWPRFTADGKQILELGEATRARPILEHAQLTLFDQFVKGGGAVSLF